jgi:hypothetical protein
LNAEPRETIIEMLRLCPGDNMNQRSWLGSLLIRVGRHADALFFAQEWIASLGGDGTPPIRGGTAFQAPSRDLLSGPREQFLEPFWAPGEILHTAALASFYLYGDCTQSSQYLRIAARLNPHILTKVLGRRTQPSKISLQSIIRVSELKTIIASLNANARAVNSLEEAHDYLWLSQDLWTEFQVWNWLNNSSDVSSAIHRICTHPDCSAQETRATEFKRCAACHTVLLPATPTSSSVLITSLRSRIADQFARGAIGRGIRSVCARPMFVDPY